MLQTTKSKFTELSSYLDAAILPPCVPEHGPQRAVYVWPVGLGWWHRGSVCFWRRSRAPPAGLEWRWFLPAGHPSVLLGTHPYGCYRIIIGHICVILTVPLSIMPVIKTLYHKTVIECKLHPTYLTFQIKAYSIELLESLTCWSLGGHAPLPVLLRSPPYLCFVCWGSCIGECLTVCQVRWGAPCDAVGDSGLTQHNASLWLPLCEHRGDLKQSPPGFWFWAVWRANTLVTDVHHEAEKLKHSKIHLLNQT